MNKTTLKAIGVAVLGAVPREREGAAGALLSIDAAIA